MTKNLSVLKRCLSHGSLVSTAIVIGLVAAGLVAIPQSQPDASIGQVELAQGGVNPNFELGPEELHEPFQCFTDGAFGVTNISGTVYAFPPVNSRACEQWVWSGSSVDTLNPTTQMNGLTTGHLDRGRVYDAAGWWPYGLWVDEATGTWYSYMHSEDHEACDTEASGPGTKDLRTIGVWTSTDQGANWTYDGVAVSLDAAKTFNPPDDDCFSQIGWPKDGGPGDFKFVVGQDDFLYIVYRQNTYHKPQDTNGDGTFDGDWTRENVGVARAPKESNGAAGSWQKYYEGAWAEPGQGGHETYVMTPYDLPTGAGMISSNGARPLWQSGQRSIIWSSYLNKYVMVFIRRGSDMWISYSSDLINWNEPEFLFKHVVRSSENDEAKTLLYTNLVDIQSGGTDQTMGRSVWLYTVTNQFEVRRRLLSFDTQQNLALDSPVVASSSYGFGSPRNLTDGDISTPFEPDTRTDTHANSGWVYADLGATSTFNQVKLHPWTKWGFGFPSEFSIDGATSASGPWTTIASYSAHPHPRDGETQVLNFSSQSYRYVRINWTKVSGSAEPVEPYGLRLMEFQVFNDTQGAPPTPNPGSAPATTYVASAGFSATPGANQWSYMHKGPLDIGGGTSFFWAPMTYNSTNNWWEEPGTASRIEAGTQNPAIGLDSARIWKAPADGVIHITGTVAKANTGGGDGVNVRILRNRSKIWPAAGDWQFIAFNDGTGYSVDHYEQVEEGDRILFIVNAIADGNSDKTAWDPSIDFRPTAATYDAATGFSSTQGTNQWRYQYTDGVTYTDLTWDASTSEWRRGGALPSVGQHNQHPDSTYDSVRTWTAPAAGFVAVEGFLRKANATPAGDGVQARVFHNSTQVWPASGWQSIAANDAFGLDANFAIEVAANDEIHFVVNRNANHSWDNSLWDVLITRTD